MSEPSNRTEVVFKHRDRRACAEPQLVLASIGISSNLIHADRWWLILVDPADEAAALRELGLHQQDNQVASPTPTKVPVFGGATMGVAVYALVISMFTFCDLLSAYQLPWREAGRMNAGEVMSGQWWRVFTALTLHVDLQHILSNLAFGGLFGWMAGRVLGGGWAWFSIVIAGGLGNFANAVVRDADHLSIGASTGVFAALGILVAHALRPPVRSTEKLLKRWSPLICGSLLLALVGVGDERTDVVAHVTGFVAGCGVGLIACRIPIAYLRHPRFQSITAIISVALILVAWAIALSRFPAST